MKKVMLATFVLMAAPFGLAETRNTPSKEELVEKFIQNFSCKGIGIFQVSRIADVIGRDNFARGVAIKFDLLKTLNENIAASCGELALKKCAPKHVRAYVRAAQGWGAYRIIRGPLQALGVTVFEANYGKEGQPPPNLFLTISVAAETAPQAHVAKCLVNEMRTPKGQPRQGMGVSDIPFDSTAEKKAP